MTRTRIYFTTDVHGSDICWRKLLRAGSFYKADAVVLGGDMTGKAVVPIVKELDGSYRSTFQGRRSVMADEQELRSHMKVIEDSGYYVHLTTREQVAGSSVDDRDRIFLQKIQERIRSWLALAERELHDQKLQFIVAPGNDDVFAIDPVLDESTVITRAEGKVLAIGDHEMISSGWTNPTPWKTSRECSEEELARRINEMASRLRNPQTSIFNLHAPPYNSGLDSAPLLDDNLRPVSAGQQMVPCGSTSVLEAIWKYQPLLGLHGHIHECRGAFKFGRTLCINPGSNYSEGLLMGVLVELEEKKVKSYLFTSG